MTTDHRSHNMDTINEIRARLEAATPGPWAVEEDDDGFDGHSVYEDDGITWGRAYVCREMHQGEDEGKSDAEFIAHAPSDVARLLAAVESVLGLCKDTDGEWLDSEFNGNTVGDIREAIQAVLGGAA